MSSISLLKYYASNDVFHNFVTHLKLFHMWLKMFIQMLKIERETF